MTHTLTFLLNVLVLLYVLFWFLVDGTVHFHYCITLPIIHTVLKKVYSTINFYYCTALPIIRTELKNQTCNIYKYSSYNRNLRVSRCIVTWFDNAGWHYRIKAQRYLFLRLAVAVCSVQGTFYSDISFSDSNHQTNEN